MLRKFCVASCCISLLAGLLVYGIANAHVDKKRDGNDYRYSGDIRSARFNDNSDGYVSVKIRTYDTWSKSEADNFWWFFKFSSNRQFWAYPTRQDGRWVVTLLQRRCSRCSWKVAGQGRFDRFSSHTAGLAVNGSLLDVERGDVARWYVQTDCECDLGQDRAPNSGRYRHRMNFRG